MSVEEVSVKIPFINEIPDEFDSVEESSSDGDEVIEHENEENLNETNINNVKNDMIKEDWRRNMFTYFNNEGFSRKLEALVRFRLVNTFYNKNVNFGVDAETNKIIFDADNRDEIDITFPISKTFQSKIKSHVNKFLTSFDIANYVIA